MTTFPILIVLALAGAGPVDAATDGGDAAAIAEIPGEPLIDMTTAAGLREAYAYALRNSSDRYPDDWERSVSDLVHVYRRLERAEGLAATESARMRRGLKSRLEQMRDRLIRAKRQRDAEAARNAAAKGGDRRLRPGLKDAAEREDGTFPGGGSLTTARAQQLIDLITNTIEPESWETNGGKGRIMFYSPLNVLVIRATGEAHGQTGDVLEQLRR